MGEVEVVIASSDSGEPQSYRGESRWCQVVQGRDRIDSGFVARLSVPRSRSRDRGHCTARRGSMLVATRCRQRYSRTLTRLGELVCHCGRVAKE